MSDTKNLEDSALYRLSLLSGLQHFKNVVLVSSLQDQYVPFDSARVQMCRKAVEESATSRKGHLYSKMVSNLFGRLNTRLIYRLDVNFKINDK